MEITKEMVEEARRKQEAAMPVIEDPGEENICLGCE